MSVSINTAECRACSAPNIKGHGGSSSSRGQFNQEAAVSKAQINRIKQQAKAEAEREVKRKYNLLALPDAPAGQLSVRARKKARHKIKGERLLTALLNSSSKKRDATGSEPDDAGSDSGDDVEVVKPRKKPKSVKKQKEDEMFMGIYARNFQSAAMYGLKGKAIKPRPGAALDSEVQQT